MKSLSYSKLSMYKESAVDCDIHTLSLSIQHAQGFCMCLHRHECVRAFTYMFGTIVNTGIAQYPASPKGFSQPYVVTG